MKILLLGKNGQVGHELQRALLPLGEVVALGRKEANLESPASIKRVLDGYAPSIIVNAAAYTAVDKAENDEATALTVNAESVKAMAQHANKTNALLVHYSTDYVYDGEKAGTYTEADTTNPQSAYGRTKLAGEQAILTSGCQALIFRTSWVFSAHGGNFVKTIIRLASERDSLGIVADQVGAPTSAELIADVTALAIAAHKKNAIANGIYHLTGTGHVSWHGFAMHIVARLKENGAALKLGTERIRPIGTEEYPLPAKRPKNSRLDTGKLSKALGLEIPHWSIYADRTIAQLTKTEI
ncbi:dTDP-4-dehydrorhamnose reductase [Pollutimonas nitritireducens]|uniref:dTDP-4-dehydrorhamnose reductase n=1 Tax=Pollutimonas nitritireducens TaxID=2045209 RepID=A0A2N4UBT3_9BURK|nr:dTDP-4-dehydrorhamnose reductase [Pollutimonas nitritireducens]PLC52480.1 dTDP-4-dehydrorhamnose reductase [Pollutimonas nitritireducens]